jgi:hypothetical protein
MLVNSKARLNGETLFRLQNAHLIFLIQDNILDHRTIHRWVFPPERDAKRKKVN